MLTHCIIAVKRSSVSKFHLDCVHRARLHADRSFCSLVTLRRLAKWGLGPEPSNETIAHEVTVCKSKLYIKGFFFFFLNILCYTFLICLLSHFRKSTMKEKKGKYVVSEGKRPKAQL